MSSDSLEPDLHAALDTALARALQAPALPAGFHARLQQTLSRAVLDQSDSASPEGLRGQLESEQQQRLSQLQEGYMRLRQRTLAALIGGAFAAGAAAALAMPWLLMRFGSNGLVILAALGAAVGLAVGFGAWAARPGVPLRPLEVSLGISCRGQA
jgi:uncharacterized membrane protein YraQ (UPF0718 family)